MCVSRRVSVAAASRAVLRSSRTELIGEVDLTPRCRVAVRCGLHAFTRTLRPTASPAAAGSNRHAQAIPARTAPESTSVLGWLGLGSGQSQGQRAQALAGRGEHGIRKGRSHGDDRGLPSTGRINVGPVEQDRVHRWHISESRNSVSRE